MHSGMILMFTESSKLCICQITYELRSGFCFVASFGVISIPLVPRHEISLLEIRMGKLLKKKKEKEARETDLKRRRKGSEKEEE